MNDDDAAYMDGLRKAIAKEAGLTVEEEESVRLLLRARTASLRYTV